MFSDPPSASLRQEIEAGTLRAEDVAERVHEAAFAQAVHERAQAVARDLSGSVERAFTAALRAGVDDLIAGLREEFDQAADTVHRLASLPLDLSAEHAVDRGLVEEWRTLGAARQTLDAVAGVRRSLAAQYDVGPAGREVTWFVAADDLTDEDALDRAQALLEGRQLGTIYEVRSEDGRGGAWHRLAAAGFRLRLNTPAESERCSSAPAPLPRRHDRRERRR